MDNYTAVAFNTSKMVTKTYSTSFSIAVSLLSKEMRMAIYSIYGFVRFADEIVDTFHGQNQKVLLEKFEQDYYEAVSTGMSMNPVLYSFMLTVKKYKIPEHLIQSFITSMKADLNKQVYKSIEELNEYIYGSADVVGLMCLMVFVNGDMQHFKKLEKPAMKLGSAFQKVNFLRDIKSDTELLGRRYFPNYDIHNFNDSLKTELIRNIEADFAEARKGMLKLPGKSKLAVYIAYVYYHRLLRNLKNTPAKQITEQRIRVNNPVKLMLLGNAYVRYKLNLL